MSSPHPPLLTPAEYLAIERRSEIRSEYIGGRMYAMSGPGSWHSLNAGNGRRHSLIAGNIFGKMWGQLRGKGCEAYKNDMRVKVGATGLYAYPDIVAVCGEARFEDSETDNLLNPAMIVEVLSPSTEAYDRGEKFANYRRIDTLQEYVLVAQDKIRIEHYLRRGANQWVLSEVSDPQATLHLVSVDCHVEVAVIYEKIEFESTAENVDPH